MKDLLRKYKSALFLLFLPLAVSVFLWLKSDLPPYGTPSNELSDQYWGILMDMARQWKTGEFSFWTRSIGGGYCMYSSGFYPLWVPFNILAKVLSFDHFYIFKLIEPYFIGVFSMALFLRHGLRLSLRWAAYGSLAYMGMVFTRHVGIIHFPFFLWGCALYPLILYAYLKLWKRSLYLRAAVVGAFMSLLFIGGGGGQYSQMIIWGLVLLGLDGLLFVKERSILRKMTLIVFSFAIFVFFSFTLAAAQILPTIGFTLFESGRTLGEYSINNFPFFGKEYRGGMSIAKFFELSIWNDGNNGVRAFWALMIFAFGKLIVDWKMFRAWCLAHQAWLNIVLATILFFLVPPTANILSALSPVFAKLFNPLRMFTFGYCAFLIDMIIVVFLVVLLNFKTFSEPLTPAQKLNKQIILLIFLVLAVVYLFSPLWMSQIFPSWQKDYIPVQWSQRYLVLICLLILVFPIPKIKIFQTATLSVSLILLGVMLLKTCYVWGEKGRQTAIQDFALDTPEHQFYRQMKGHYFLPFVDPGGTKFCYGSMTHNYDLLYEIDGLGGFLNIPPKRLGNFINAFHNDVYWTKNTPAYKFNWRSTPASLVSYFPVEFTTIPKGTPLPWPGFSKAVDGKVFDIWTRDHPVAPVRFAKEVRIVSYRELIDSFDRPFEGILYMTPEDAARYSPPVLETIPTLKQAAFLDFQRKRPDELTFDVETNEELYIVLPEIYQNGWRLKVNGQVATVFPASSIFVGFFLEKGKHHVELVFRPVFWEAGWLLSLISLGLFGGIIYFYSRKRKKNR